MLTKRFKLFAGVVITFIVIDLVRVIAFGSRGFESGFELIVVAFIAAWIFEEFTHDE